MKPLGSQRSVRTRYNNNIYNALGVQQCFLSTKGQPELLNGGLGPGPEGSEQLSVAERHFKLASDGSGARGDRLPPALGAAAEAVAAEKVVEVEAVVMVEVVVGLVKLQVGLEQKVGEGSWS